MKEIVFYSFRTGNRDIFVMSAEGGTPRQLTNDPGQDHYPDWSPDGKKIVFQSSRTGQYEVYVLSWRRTSYREELTTADERWGATAEVVPDGALIAFSSRSHVSVVPAEGGRLGPWLRFRTRTRGGRPTGRQSTTSRLAQKDPVSGRFPPPAAKQSCWCVSMTPSAGPFGRNGPSVPGVFSSRSPSTRATFG